jgi:ATP/maltotriose-dependent transcriptional regulator MalT
MVMNLLSVMAMSLGCAGQYRRSSSLFADAERFGRDHGISTLMARSFCMQAGIAFELGAVDYARELATSAQRAAIAADFAPSIVSTKIDLLLIEIASGNLAEAEKLRPGVEAAQESAAGFHGWIWRQRLILARGQFALAQGDISEAESAAKDLIESAKKNGRVKYGVAGMRLLSEVSRHRDDMENARNHARAALEQARKLRYPALELQACASLFALTGDDKVRDEGRKKIAEICPEIEDTVLLDGLRSRYGSLL